MVSPPIPNNANPAPAVDALITAVRTDDNLGTAIRNLSADQTRQAVPRLAQIVTDSTAEADRRERAIITLKLLRRPEAIPILGRIIADREHTSADMRREAANAIDQIDRRAGFEHLVTALSDPDADVRDVTDFAIKSVLPTLVNAYENTPDAAVRDRIRTRLVLLPPGRLAQYLNNEDNEREDQQAAARTLGIVGDGEAVNALCMYIDSALTAANQPVPDSDEAFQAQLVAAQKRDAVLFSVLAALNQIGGAEIVACTSELLEHAPDANLRRVAAENLGQVATAEAITHLWRAYFTDQVPEVRRKTIDVLTGINDWPLKNGRLLDFLPQSKLETGELNEEQIIAAVNPPDTAARQALIDRLITFALDKAADGRVLSITADLIIAAADKSKARAGERIEAYQQTTERDISAEALQALRVEIGGTRALNPILSRLAENLEENFQQPVRILNTQTRTMWERAVFIALVGFGLRAALSVLLFGIGAYLVLDSYQQLVAGTFSMEALFGPGVSFATGIATMFAMIYRGPLREIRKAVNDVGVANAAFIGYVHRVLEISYTFSYLYLTDRISFTDAAEASRLIEDAVDDTIRLLNHDPKEDAGPADDKPSADDRPSTP